MGVPLFNSGSGPPFFRVSLHQGDLTRWLLAGQSLGRPENPPKQRAAHSGKGATPKPEVEGSIGLHPSGTTRRCSFRTIRRDFWLRRGASLTLKTREGLTPVEVASSSIFDHLLYLSLQDESHDFDCFGPGGKGGEPKHLRPGNGVLSLFFHLLKNGQRTCPLLLFWLLVLKETIAIREMFSLFPGGDKSLAHISPGECFQHLPLRPGLSKVRNYSCFPLMDNARSMGPGIPTHLMEVHMWFHVPFSED